SQLYPLSLHDALPISPIPPTAVSSGTGLYAIVKCVSSVNPCRCTSSRISSSQVAGPPRNGRSTKGPITCQISDQQSQPRWPNTRSEEHTSELQSRSDL